MAPATLKCHVGVCAISVMYCCFPCGGGLHGDLKGWYHHVPGCQPACPGLWGGGGGRAPPRPGGAWSAGKHSPPTPWRRAPSERPPPCGLALHLTLRQGMSEGQRGGVTSQNSPSPENQGRFFFLLFFPVLFCFLLFFVFLRFFFFKATFSFPSVFHSQRGNG